MLFSVVEWINIDVLGSYQVMADGFYTFERLEYQISLSYFKKNLCILPPVIPSLPLNLSEVLTNNTQTKNPNQKHLIFTQQSQEHHLISQQIEDQAVQEHPLSLQ